MSWYRDKRVFLVGGTKGIGRQAAEQLAEAGAHVVVAARGQQGLDETVAAMKARAGGATRLGAVRLDVTDEASVKAGCDEAWDILGHVDVLIVNSGASQPGLLLEQAPESFQQQMDLNYLGPVRCVRAVLPRMQERGSGHICLVSSIAGYVCVYGYAGYSASKAALIAFVESARQEAMLHGVRLTCFLPPTTDTPGLEEENHNKPPYLRIMEDESMFNRTEQAGPVATAMLRGIERGTVQNYTSWPSWLMFWMYHHFPRTSRWLADGELRTAVKKAKQRGLTER